MRDTELTMSNLQSLAIPINANLGATDSTAVVPVAAADSGYAPGQGMVWKVAILEATTPTPIQVEGKFLAELQFSLDAGSTWQIDQGVEMVIARDPALPDPCLPASGKARNAVAIGRPLQDQADPKNVRYKTVYTTAGRVSGDVAATVKVLSFLGGPGDWTGD